jgi:hypothetical protein
MFSHLFTPARRAQRVAHRSPSEDSLSDPAELLENFFQLKTALLAFN